MMIRLLALSVLAFLPVFTAAHAQEDLPSNVERFQVNMKVVPYSTMWNEQMDQLELKMLKQFPSFLPVNTDGYNDYYRAGVLIVANDRTVIGYVLTGGMYEGTFWKIAFDPEMSSKQRRSLLAMTAPYVQNTIAKLDAYWKTEERGRSNYVDTLMLRVDFLDNDPLSFRWIVEMFGKYNSATVEDTARSIEQTVREIKEKYPERPLGEVGAINNVVRGFDFKKYYSPNLRREAELQPDGSLVIRSRATGKILGTIAPQDSGTPKIRFDSTNISMDYGPGKKKYLFGVGDYSLLYSTDNWAPRKRAGIAASVGGTCQNIFTLKL